MRDTTKAKENLIRVKSSIRKKFRDLHAQQTQLNERVQEELKPIIDPLHNIQNLISKTTPPTSTSTATPKNTEHTRKTIKRPFYRRKQLYNSADIYKTAKSTKNLDPKRLFTNVSNSQRKVGKKVYQQKGEDSNDIENDSFAESFLSLSESEAEMSEADEEDAENTASSLALQMSQQQKQLQQQSQQRISSTKKRDSVIQDRYQTRALNSPTYYNTYELNGKLYIGNSEVKINNTHITVEGIVYNKTHGLLDLLMMTKPKFYTQADLSTYKRIIENTNCHRLNFDPKQRIVRNLTEKYKSVIQQLFPLQKGGSISKHIRANKLLQSQFMIADRRKANTYTYWDNPNELVDRLRLLIASQSAGHTGHTNEIVSIIEELKEARIIQ